MYGWWPSGLTSTLKQKSDVSHEGIPTWQTSVDARAGGGAAMLIILSDSKALSHRSRCVSRLSTLPIKSNLPSTLNVISRKITNRGATFE
jgi:hypothetical protein